MQVKRNGGDGQVTPARGKIERKRRLTFLVAAPHSAWAASDSRTQGGPPSTGSRAHAAAAMAASASAFRLCPASRPVHTARQRENAMRLRTVSVILAVVLLAVFAAANWAAFTAPTRLNLLVATVEAPLGLVMLGLLATVTLVFAVWMASWQAVILMETRRNAKELQQQRAVADQAEASRFSELRAALHVELEQLAGRVDAARDAMRVDLRENINSLAAVIAEMDDRLRRNEAK
jgi:uncharacterized integral membrane protein